MSAPPVAPPALVRYSFNDHLPDAGPDTFSVFQFAQGSVTLSTQQRFSGYRSVELRDAARGDRDPCRRRAWTAERAYAAGVASGRVFVHWGLRHGRIESRVLRGWRDGAEALEPGEAEVALAHLARWDEMDRRLATMGAAFSQYHQGHDPVRNAGPFPRRQSLLPVDVGLVWRGAKAGSGSRKKVQ